MQTTNQPNEPPVPPAPCPICGRPLPPHVPPSRCPGCFLRQGLPTDAVDTRPASVVFPEAASSRGWPHPGETFGHYRIIRPLGHGGMGAVFEAEDLESGRRIALKVLGHRIDSPEARTRFFREGRLAASVNHPNSVYVFGTEEIAGIPVIAMELVAGGTLQERVARHGPLPVAEVADSVLQIIAGLEAAQRVGVLHRDIKPSNCFIERDGTVKIGDFGLSISTFARAEPTLTTTGTFLGTPAFASPEQLRGDELTVRSDIYSVGVTLYYLLTGHHPFQAPDLVRLLATVLERPAESPAQRRPGLPGKLCRMVLRCLEKDPDQRFRNYDEVRAALLPHASTAPAPAPLVRRFLAHCWDTLLLMLPSIAIHLLVRGAGEPSPLTTHQILLMSGWSAALALTYYGLLEGLWGASVGKYLCRLRVVRLDRTVPGVWRALWRAFIFATVPSAAGLLAGMIGAGGTSGLALGSWLSVSGLVSVALGGFIFATARRRNGFAGLHDLASGTRVLVRSTYQPRPSLTLASEALPTTESLPLIGPYHVLERLDGEAGAELLLGFDARLLRRVWIRRQPPGSPPIAPALRDLGRPGRLRWLTARRTETEAWDAYEAAAGRPLLELIAEPQAWDRVRYWLLDLAEELRAAAQSGSLPATLAMDRVWITTDGRAKLLDFPAPATGSRPPAPVAQPPPDCGPPMAPTFLRQVAITALAGLSAETQAVRAQEPLALHASQFLATLRPDANLQGCIAELESLLNLPARISRRRRAVLLAVSLAFPLLVTAVSGQVRIFRQALDREAALPALFWYLAQHEGLEKPARSGGPRALADREALETYIAGRFAPIITNAIRGSGFGLRAPMAVPAQARAERILAARPAPSAEQFAAVSAKVERLFGKPPGDAAPGPGPRATQLAAVLLSGYSNAVIFVIFPCLIGSLLFRGGALVKLLGIVFVDRQGAPASRGRVTARNLVAWLPLLVLPLLVEVLTPVLSATGALLLLPGLTAGLALLSVLLPQRGLADRVVGTWPVPR